MRLWSLHPMYLDSKGLVALWREGLLAQKVLMNQTRGYRHHPQLQRFKDAKNPLQTLRSYLWEVVIEAQRRGYQFDASKIKGKRNFHSKIPVTHLQLQFESEHLLKKLKKRALQKYKFLTQKQKIKWRAHPLFRVVRGSVADWERK